MDESPFSPPPRGVSFTARFMLLFGNGMQQYFGWFFGCFGMLFCVMILPNTKSLAAFLFFSWLLFFPLVGFGIVAWYFFFGLKAIRLLRGGEIAWGTYYDSEPSPWYISEGFFWYHRHAVKLFFEFETPDGVSHGARTTVFETEYLKNDRPKLVFYDPHDPTRSIVFDGLFGGVWFDEETNVFRCHWSWILPSILCLAVFSVELVLLFFSKTFV